MSPAQLPPEWRELYEERAAIIEEGCKIPPEMANERALMDILRQMRGAEEAAK